jgi:cell division protein FtsB
LKSEKNRGRFWTKILILLFLIATVYLTMTYYKQSQVNEDLQHQISDLMSSNALAMSVNRQSEQSAEQLKLKQYKLESDIKVAENNLQTSLITNDHITTLVQVAREAGVRLTSVISSDPKPTTFETVPLDVMTFKIEAEGSSRSNMIDFVSQICEVLEMGIIQNAVIQISGEPEDIIILLSFDLNIYSYRDQQAQ